MNDIKTDNRALFFPRSKEKRLTKADNSTQSMVAPRNNKKKQMELKNLVEFDSKVDIPNKIKDFSRIKKAVEKAPPKNKDEKISGLKDLISKGEYKMDFDKIAEKILAEEF